VEAIHARGFSKRTELERVVLRKPSHAPIVVSLQFPRFARQVRAYLRTAGFTPAETGRFLSERGHRYDPATFRLTPPPGSAE